MHFTTRLTFAINSAEGIVKCSYLANYATEHSHISSHGTLRYNDMDTLRYFNGLLRIQQAKFDKIIVSIDGYGVCKLELSANRQENIAELECESECCIVADLFT